MLFLRSWLEEYIDLSGYNDQQLANIISLKSGECEGYRQLDDWFEGKVVIGKICNPKKHPQADNLWCFQVDAGEHGLISVVSGAPNVKHGLVVPLAMVGCKLPYLTIAPRTLKGVQSSGMCCGKDELMLQTHRDSGLWELETEILNMGYNLDEVLGQSLCQVLPNHFPLQSVFEVKYLHDQYSTAGSHLGLALELAKVLQKPELLKPFALQVLDPAVLLKNYQTQIKSIQRLQRDDQDYINFADYTQKSKAFWVFKADLTNFQMPCSLVQRLFFTNKNLVGSIADLSNYLLWDVGQPSHFFSYQKVKALDSKGWNIGFNDKVQKFSGLGQLKSIDIPVGVPVMTTDSGNIVHLPGISGGEQTKVEASDNQVLIEIANFDPETIARACFAINYRSDSSKFWSSGVNQARMIIYLIQLLNILSNSSLQLVFGYFNNHKKNDDLNSDFFYDQLQSQLQEAILERTFSLDENNTKQGNFNLKEINLRLDGQPTLEREQKINHLINYLGQRLDNKLLANPFYSNWSSQEDLLFEISKLLGFEVLSSHHLNIKKSWLPSLDYKFKIWTSDLAANLGFFEIISRPFVNQSLLIDKNTALEAISSQRVDENFLRDSLLSSLMLAVAKNINLGIKNLRIFENAKIYTHNNIELVEKEVFGAILVDDSPYQLITLLNLIVNSLGLKVIEIESTENLETSWIGKGYIYNYANTQAKVIEVSKKVKKLYNLELNKKIWYLDFFIPPKIDSFNPFKKYTESSIYPIVSRSYSLQLNTKTHWFEVALEIEKQTIKDTKLKLLPKERFKLEIMDKNNQEKNNSLEIINFDIEYICYTRTLEKAEIEQFWSNCFERLKELDKDLKMR